MANADERGVAEDGGNLKPQAGALIMLVGGFGEPVNRERGL